MVKELRVLAPVGEDPLALGLLILPLAAVRPVHVTLFHVGDGGKLREAARIFRRLGLRVEPKSAQGEPVREIASFARVGDFDLLAMISHGRRGLSRTFLGSVAEQVLRHTRLPLLLAHPGSTTGAWRLIAASVDGSAASERVLEQAGVFAHAAGTPLHLLHVHPPGHVRKARELLDVLCARLEKKGTAALPFLRMGDPAAQIVRYAKGMGVSLLCMTTHARNGLKRWMFGSVTEEVARRAPCPVWIGHP